MAIAGSTQSLDTTRAQSPLHAEAEGIIWAMQEARERGFDDIMFVSDCQQLINLACKEEEWPSIAAELDEIKLWRSKFNNVALSFVPRSETSVRTPWLKEDDHVRNDSRM
ncbi:hypothetical protein DY000_02053374 [Brassica cretica]|uniref:RNase H type-1 domain-containing protein n=1 Tax=Brassica cretica TaxID=69181 RepID=A0ABQ7AMC7_BRACR|nr:hypothetical protein DY000_02053374 [Brassica cretica]